MRALGLGLPRETSEREAMLAEGPAERLSCCPCSADSVAGALQEALTAVEVELCLASPRPCRSPCLSDPHLSDAAVRCRT